MPTPSEHKTVQARILEYAGDIGLTFVPRDEAEQRNGFEQDVPPKDYVKSTSFFFGKPLDANIRDFNPLYAEPISAPNNQFCHLCANIYNNRKFVDYLHNSLLQRRNATVA